MSAYIARRVVSMVPVLWFGRVLHGDRELVAAARVCGATPLPVERLWHKMWVPKIIGSRGLTTRAISAIDIGLWDIRAK